MKITNIKNILKHFVPDKHIDGIANELLYIFNNAIAAEREANGWKPIESAPKDGTEINLWVYGESITDCRWLNGKWMFYGIDSFDNPSYVAIEGDPMYFMHKPAAPKDEVSE